MTDLVSVCIPVYNGSEYLEQSIKSVISQDYPLLEIIIVDDCSSDSSVAIAQKYAKDDDRIRVEQNSSNLGLVGNWNKCISLASGKWFKFHFQDDIMQPACITEMLTFAISNHVNLVLSDRKYFFEKDVPQKQRDFYSNRLNKLDHHISISRVISPGEIAHIFTRDFLGQNFLGEPIVGLINTNLFDKYGTFDPYLRQVCDFEFWLRIGLNEGIGFVKNPLIHFRVHGASQTSKNAKGRKDNPPVSIRMIDRVHLGLTLINSDLYNGYRQFLSSSLSTTIERLVSTTFTQYIASTGYFTSRKFFGKEAFTYFKYNPAAILQALYNDLYRLISSKISFFLIK